MQYMCKQTTWRFVVCVGLMWLNAAAHAQDGLTFREVHFSLLVGGHMDTPRQATVTPDGADVYVAAEGSRKIVQFRRNVADGTLEFASFTIVEPESSLFDYRITRVVSSPNNRFVYAAIDLDNVFGFACLQRDLATGELTPIGTLLNDDPMLSGLAGTNSMVFAPDGGSFYVLGTNNPGPATEAIAEIAVDPVTGLMSAVQRLNIVPAAGGIPFALPFYQVVASPDGRNLYVAAGTQGGVQVFDVNSTTGAVTFDTLVALTALNNPPLVQSVAISPNGAQVYAADTTGGALVTLPRDSAGNLTVPSRGTGGGAITSLPTITKVVMAPDGDKLYTLSFGEIGGSVAHVSAFARDAQSGLPTLLETIQDGLSGSPAILGNDWPAVSSDSANLYLPASNSYSLAVFSSERPNLPCDDFPVITDEFENLRTAYALYADIDEDGLPETASLALLEEASCGDVADGFDEAITNAYLVNLAGAGSELEVYSTGEWAPYRHALATLRLLSESMGVYLNNAFDPFGMQMHDFYVSVSCTDGACEPANARDIDLRAPDEPFSGEGDPDEDGFTNAEEWANVLARGGDEHEFAISALDPLNDGSMPVSSGGGGGGDGGGCFIATAAYGTPLADELDRLRDVRDRDLLTSAFGAAFTDAYYRLSPPMARIVATNPVIAALVRGALATLLFSPAQFAVLGLTSSALGVAWVAGHRRRTRQQYRSLQ